MSQPEVTESDGAGGRVAPGASAPPTPEVELHVLLFGRARELAGAGERWLRVPDGASVGQAADRLSAFYPAMAPLLQRCSFALNGSYATRDETVRGGDELAILPPIGGG
jgi:molybdopterin converting factor small subunit